MLSVPGRRRALLWAHHGASDNMLLMANNCPHLYPWRKRPCRELWPSVSWTGPYKPEDDDGGRHRRSGEFLAQAGIWEPRDNEQVVGEQQGSFGIKPSGPSQN